MKRPYHLAVALLLLTACGGVTQGDPHHDGGEPNTIGTGARIREISNPTTPSHLATGASVTITGASTVFVDSFDETQNGKSRGTVYLQDFESTEPYSGISLFQPSYSPSNLHLGAGDVVDLTGTYEENNSKPVQFPANEFLIQVTKPQVTFRLEYHSPTPRVIDVKDLSSYQTGRQWLSMVVTVKDITIPFGLTDDGKGRSTAFITSATAQSSPTVTNELFDLAAWNQTSQVIKQGAHISSLTGVVTYFFAMHIAPRSKEDIVQ
jgi:hypothetical protein